MSTSRFEDWTDCKQVDCNQCSHYYDNSCDGIPEGSQKLCTSFLATRRVVIPLQIKRLQNAVNKLVWGYLFTTAALLIHIITHVFGG